MYEAYAKIAFQLTSVSHKSSTKLCCCGM